MLAIVLALLLTVVVALGIMVLVAVPYLRQGSRILTPGGEQVVRRAGRQARRRPLAAAGSTWHGLVGLHRLLGRLLGRVGRRVARVWTPVSEALHARLDRLESRDAPMRHVARPDGAGPDDAPAHDAQDAQDHDATGEDARRTEGPAEPVRTDVGRPRPVPAVSGAIPGITIDLREPAHEDTGSRIDAVDHPADAPAVGARHAR